MLPSRRLPTSLALAALVLASLIMTGCARTDKAADAASDPKDVAGLVAVKLQLNWYPETEHGGYFAALVKGYYREAGLDVTIVPGGTDTPVIQQVARGITQFGVANGDNVLFARAQQAPIVCVMAPLQNSPRCIIVHESSGIENFDGLKDMTIAMSNSNAFTQFLRHKLPLTGVKIVPYPGNVAMFLLDKNYAQQGYVFSEPIVARKEGGDPKVLMLSTLGYNPYSSTLITTDDQIARHGDVVHKMVAASARGWAEYLRSPEETNRYIHKLNPEMELDVLDKGAETLGPLVMDDVTREHGIGYMTRERWQTLADQLIASDQLKPADAHVDAAFTDRFLDAVKPQE